MAIYLFWLLSIRARQVSEVGYALAHHAALSIFLYPDAFYMNDSLSEKKCIFAAKTAYIGMFNQPLCGK